jgi:hypothetical protein
MPPDAGLSSSFQVLREHKKGRMRQPRASGRLFAQTNETWETKN